MGHENSAPMVTSGGALPRPAVENPSRRGSRPRIGVDFHTFDGAFQGSRSRHLAIFEQLLPLAEEYDFLFFTGEPELLREALPPLDPERVRFVPLVTRRSTHRLLVELPRLAKQHAVDLFHAQYIFPRGLTCRRVVDIYDVLFESHPHFFPRTFVWRSKLLMRRAAKIADEIVTISEYSAQEIRTRYGVPAERITISPCAVDRERFSPSALDPDRLRQRGLVPDQYILTVGRIDPRKNIAALIEAYGRLDPALTRDLPLVVVGHVVDTRTARSLDADQDSGRVLHLPDVDDDELPGLYAGARCFAFPSHAEGFGMPILEAMAAGAPVLSSNRTSIPEVSGNDAALLIDPERGDEIERGLRELLEDGELRARLRANGLDRAKDFCWQKEAHRLRAVYARALASA